MIPRKSLAAVRVLAAFGLVWLGSTSAAEPEPAKGEPITVIDAGGKEHKLKAYKLSTGTRPLGWKGGAPALAFREEGSTNFVEGILTLVPLDRIRSIDYDGEAESVSATVATADKDAGDVVLKGSTKYRGINKLSIDAEVDKGELGIAEIKFQGGVPKGSIRGVRFPSAKAPTAAPAGRVAQISTSDKKDKGPFKVYDLQAVYRMGDGTEKLLPTIFFKKSLKVDLSKLESINASEGSKEGAEWVVKFKGGEEHTLTLLTVMPDDPKAHLEALVGEVSTGYRLFPVSLIGEITFEDGKKEEKKE